MDRERAAELERARREQADSHLVLGILYAAAGVFDEAERELKALAADNPQSPLPQRLHGELASARRR